MEVMGEKNIDCRPFFHPLSSIPAFECTEQARQARARNQVSYEISPYGVNLPSGMNLTEDKVRYVRTNVPTPGYNIQHTTPTYGSAQMC